MVLASLSIIFCQQAFSAVRGYTILSGSEAWFVDLKPGERAGEVMINNDNNLNVGYDLIEQGTSNVIAMKQLKTGVV